MMKLLLIWGNIFHDSGNVSTKTKIQNNNNNNKLVGNRAKSK